MRGHQTLVTGLLMLFSTGCATTPDDPNPASATGILDGTRCFDGADGSNPLRTAEQAPVGDSNTDAPDPNGNLDESRLPDLADTTTSRADVLPRLSIGGMDAVSRRRLADPDSGQNGLPRDDGPEVSKHLHWRATVLRPNKDVPNLAQPQSSDISSIFTAQAESGGQRESRTKQISFQGRRWRAPEVATVIDQSPSASTTGLPSLTFRGSIRSATGDMVARLQSRDFGMLTVRTDDQVPVSGSTGVRHYVVKQISDSSVLLSCPDGTLVVK